MKKPRIPLPKQTERSFRDRKSDYNRQQAKRVEVADNEWLVECPNCGDFIQLQRTDPAICPKCLSPDIDTTPVGSLETFQITDQPETCRRCGARTYFKEMGVRQLHKCPACSYQYWVEE